MRLGGQDGQAVLETFLLGLLLLVPLMWALGVLADLHRAALAASAAAREAGSEAARAIDERNAEAAIAAAVRQAFVDHGLNASDASVDWTANPGLPRGSAVEVSVSFPVTMVQAPFLGRVAGPSIWVKARHVARVDLYRSRE